MGAIRSFQGVQGTIGQPTAQVIDGSLKFDAGSSQYLGRTPGSAGNRKTFTVSTWIKGGNYSSEKIIFAARSDANNRSLIFFSSNNIYFQSRTSGSLNVNFNTPGVFRDPNAWFHLVVSIQSNDQKIYINGEESASNNVDLTSIDTFINSTSVHGIGAQPGDIYGPIDASLSQFYLIDGLALGPGYFGFTDPLTGTWRPKKFRAEGTTVNDGTTWSTTCTFLRATSGFNGSFDTANAAYLSSAGTGTITTAPFTIKNKLRIYNNARSDQGGKYTVTLNGIPVSFDGIGTSSTAYRWTDIDLSGFSLPLKVTNLQYTVPGSSGTGFDAVEVDGVTMLDSTTTNLAFGTNGFYLPMDNQDDFEKDKSGKGNDWTKNNFSGTSINPDVLKDSPSGAVFGGRAQTGITTTSSAPANYCTLNPMDKESNVVLSNGNLDGTASGGDGNYRGTIPMKTGKFYWEITQVSGGNYSTYGIIRSTLPVSTLNTDTITYRNDGLTKKDGVEGSTYNSISGDEVLGIACDCDKNEISYYKNNTLQGTLTFTTEMADDGVSAYGRWNNGKSADYNFGQKPFKYAPPQGFLPINSATVRPNKVVPRPDQYVGVTTYTSDSSNPISIRSFNFKPDMVWGKDRDGANNWHQFDSVRGPSSSLDTSGTGGEQDWSSYFLSFDDNGFTVSAGNHDLNRDTNKMCAWAWKAGGSKGTFNVDDVGYASAAAAGLDGGTITPVGASVGTKQGFSIVKFQGTGATANFSHGLEQAPDFMVCKADASGPDWGIYHRTLGSNKVMYFTTAAAATSTTAWDDTHPTDSLVYLGANGTTNQGGADSPMIYYIWHNVPGLQKFGQFTGNSSADGVFVELGFKPSILLIKNDNSTGDWIIWDNERNKINPVNRQLWPYTTSGTYGAYDQVASNYPLDFLSNGFKMRTTDADMNDSGRTYIYAAWAEAPASNLFGGQSNAR